MPDKCKQRNKSSGCYHCGSSEHRARLCPTANCSLCNGLGHDAGGCPTKTLPPVDLGGFAAATTNNKETFTYVELFAGMGGFRVALDRMGGRCVFASETDPFCRRMYSRNFGGDRPAGDITRISADQVPSHDLLVGGFPCQPFSSSGSREGLDDPRGVLFREICRILNSKQPSIFLLENVRGLTLHKDGDTLRTIVHELEQCGYEVVHQLVDAVNLLPQERSRLYLAGMRNDAASQSLPYKFPDLPSLSRGVEDIIHTQEGVDQLSPDNLEKLSLSPRQVEKVQAQKYTQRYPEARFLVDLRNPAKTLQSSYARYMVGSQFVRSGNGWRRFSAREAARLQGFPESFELCSQRAYHMIGNAVAPPVVAMIVAPLLLQMNYLNGESSSDDVFGWRIARQLLLDSSPEDFRREILAQKLQFQVISEKNRGKME
jgi:DNA (cytosine-5)-methyltransferase 1